MLCLAPVSNAATDNPALGCPIQGLVDSSDEPPPIPLPLGMGDWVWEMMMDYLTVPLAPGDQNVWPQWMWRDQWFIAYHRGQQEGTWAVETRVPVTTRMTELTTRPGGKTCDTS